MEKETATLSVSRRYLKIGNSEPIFLYTFIDVTNQKQMEMQLRKTEKLAVAGELISGIAHEIKNPLTSMKGFADLVWKRLDDREFVKKFASIISEEINRLNQLIERFLSFAKPELGLMSDVNLSKIVRDTLDIVTYNINKYRIELTVTLDETLTIHGSREMLIQVLINILLNAMQALEQSDKTVRMIKIYNRVRTDSIELIIEDNGPGIDDDDIDKVFNPFFTTKSEGSGLGLPISHRIMTEHNGTIRIESKVGSYTRMILGFPAIKELLRIK
jgi:polar amino acid transport system substrate-binding protein